jgi:two-component system, cell cycle sensor histidine kinase and response regulator CckA
MDRMLRRIIGEDIQLTTMSDPDLGTVRADLSQVEQVLLNLVVNARDAMPTGGRLTVELRNVELDEKYAEEHLEVRPGHYVLLAVTDTGCGMNAATMSHVFEPFFTTKGAQGSGLGLATVYGIAKQSGGHVAVYSEVGTGTIFKFYLPRVDENSAPYSSSSTREAIPHGNETVLLAEDDRAVRDLSRLILRECGYTVLEADDGKEALRIAEEHPGKVDLLITDVVMPQMSGRELAQRLEALQPGLKLLFLSGYTDDAVVRHGILQAEVAFLQKPFSPVALARKVREVLDEAQPAGSADRAETPREEADSS